MTPKIVYILHWSRFQGQKAQAVTFINIPLLKEAKKVEELKAFKGNGIVAQKHKLNKEFEKPGASEKTTKSRQDDQEYGKLESKGYEPTKAGPLKQKPLKPETKSHEPAKSDPKGLPTVTTGQLLQKADTHPESSGEDESSEGETYRPVQLASTDPSIFRADQIQTETARQKSADIESKNKTEDGVCLLFTLRHFISN